MMPVLLFLFPDNTVKPLKGSPKDFGVEPFF
ncbi:hypothetical protein SAMN04488122_1124 [Chitinophaga arvensicola]|uniref:Uncharacterized protein n=1 Tax=Chitinophaga arvensicola TaxID=29529 RepID=A0A1I0Q0E2_9BACT|nr:hypothetical protein SAMN04488122_1124 [Chitinophaga arvensicola]